MVHSCLYFHSQFYYSQLILSPPPPLGHSNVLSLNPYCFVFFLSSLAYPCLILPISLYYHICYDYIRSSNNINPLATPQYYHRGSTVSLTLIFYIIPIHSVLSNTFSDFTAINMNSLLLTSLSHSSCHPFPSLVIKKIDGDLVALVCTVPLI